MQIQLRRVWGLHFRDLEAQVSTMLGVLESQMHLEPLPQWDKQDLDETKSPPLVVVLMLTVWGLTFALTGRALLAANNVHRPFQYFMNRWRFYWRRMMAYYYG
jgi:hypothetical protein